MSFGQWFSDTVERAEAAWAGYKVVPLQREVDGPADRPESYVEYADRMAGESNMVFTQHADGTLTVDCTPGYLRIHVQVMESIRKGGNGMLSRHDQVDGTEYVTLGIPYAAEYEVLGLSGEGAWYVGRLTKSAEAGDWDEVQEDGE